MRVPRELLPTQRTESRWSALIAAVCLGAALVFALAVVILRG